MRAPKSWYWKGIGSVASSLPLAGPNEGSALEIFELISVWAETAHFQLPTPREYWRGQITGSERSWDLPLGGIVSHCRLALELLGSQELACGWAGHLPYWQGFRVRTEQGMGCVCSPAPTSH